MSTGLAQPVVTTPAMPTPAPPTGSPIAGVQVVTGMRGGPQFQLFSNGEVVEFKGPITRRMRMGYSNKSGLQLSIRGHGSSQLGYQPIAVTAKLRRNAVRDRTITFEFRAGNWYNEGRSIAVSQTFLLAKGASSASTTLLVPQYEDWQLCGWNVTVDRQLDDELSTKMMSMAQQATGFSLTALVVSDSTNTVFAQPAMQIVGSGAANVRTRRLSELPTDWLSYSTLDVVLIEAADWSRLSVRHSREADAILRWVRTGGNLWIADAGRSWENLPMIERAIGLRASNSSGADNDDAGANDAAALARGWHFVPLNERATEPIEGALELSGYDVGTAATTTPRSSADVAAVTLWSTVETSRPRFAVRPYGMGTVTAFRENLANASTNTETMSLVQRSLLMPRSTAISRQGNRPDSSNAEFNNWLIPGVGTAPVGQFQFLITLFVLIIGPLNYWWLKRRNKLPMLLTTVPAAAAVVTFLLLSFGVLSDGLGVRIRARSFTLLDQPAGEASTWARISYYAGMNPRAGLVMPRDVAVYPINPAWGMRSYNRGAKAERRLTWGKSQGLEQGWLASRTPTQYLTMTSRPSRKRLELRKTPEGLRIVNRLGATVTHLVVQDHDGALFWCEGLAPDEGRVVPVADDRDFDATLRRLFLDKQPEFPPGAEMPMYGQYYDHVLSQNLMESQIEAINSPLLRKWANGNYLAVTERGIEVDLGVEDSSEEASFHVIRGIW